MLWEVGRAGEERQIPTAPSECILSLWKSVYGLPVTKGVEVPMSPSYTVLPRESNVSVFSELRTFVAEVNLSANALLRPSGALSLK